MATEEPGAVDELRIIIQQVARGIRNNRGDEHLGDTQLAVLMNIRRSGPLTPSELAALERITPPSMNRAINNLEELGLVTRTRSENDARKVLVELTPAAYPVLDETRRLRIAWFTRRLEALEPDEREALIAITPILRKLLDS